MDDKEPVVGGCNEPRTTVGIMILQGYSQPIFWLLTTTRTERCKLLNGFVVISQYIDHYDKKGHNMGMGYMGQNPERLVDIPKMNKLVELLGSSCIHKLEMIGNDSACHNAQNHSINLGIPRFWGRNQQSGN